MIDRTDIELRLAAHAAKTARINERGWQRQHANAGRSARAALAGLLVALATRLDRGARPAARTLGRVRP
jgi:sugar (pentulose or hexulose) kinase